MTVQGIDNPLRLLVLTTGTWMLPFVVTTARDSAGSGITVQVGRHHRHWDAVDRPGTAVVTTVSALKTGR